MSGHRYGMNPAERAFLDADRRDRKSCLCKHGERPLGRADGIDMGRGIVRLDTHPNCPAHALCQGYTKAERAKRPSGSKLYCNVHGTKDCDAAPRRRKAERGFDPASADSGGPTDG